LEIKNTFSWSKSRSETFQSCERKYWFNHYGFWGGWKDQAPERTRKIYQLKKLHNRFSWAGDFVHRKIKDVIEKLLVTGEAPEKDKFIEEAVSQMREEYKQSLQQLYKKKPNRFLGLQEHEYDVKLKPEAWQKMRDQVIQNLHTFYDSGPLTHLFNLDRESFLSCEKLESFEIDGIKVWVSLDLVFIDSEQTVHIWDWKTGQKRSEDLSIDPQLAVYILFASQKFQTEKLKASLIYLSDPFEKKTVVFDEVDFNSFFQTFKSSVEEMLEKCRDIPNNETNESNFERTGFLKSSKICKNCQFRKVCLSEEQLRSL
jgi:CRISPR/Cas system-associated exonuclease Cas4 (RecB family)